MSRKTYHVEPDHTQPVPAWQVVRRNVLGQGWVVGSYSDETRAHVLAAALMDAAPYEVD